MSDGELAENGILRGARRLARRAWDYIRSDEAKSRIDGARRKAVEVGKAASIGAKEVGARAVSAAGRAKERADEFSRSEEAKAVRAKARDGWEEIRGGAYRSSPLSESRLVVALALVLCFPLGMYLLWRHPTLRRNPKWWLAGSAWAFLITMKLFGGPNGGIGTSPAPRIAAATNPASEADPEGEIRSLSMSDKEQRKEIYRSLRRSAQNCWLRCCIEGDVHGIDGTAYQYALRSYQEWVPQYRRGVAESFRIPEALLIDIYAEGNREGWYGSDEGWATPYPSMRGEPVPIYRYAPGEL